MKDLDSSREAPRPELRSELGGNTPRRYVVLEHEVRVGEVHYDLCLEDGAVLVTFQLDAPPSTTQSVAGRRSFDHRPLYLDYEGELSRGRGRVRAWDRGLVEDLAGDPRALRYSFRCQGEQLAGEWTLHAEPGEDSTARLVPGVEEVCGE